MEWKHPRYRLDQNRVARGNVLKQNKKKREKTETHKNGVMEKGPNGNELHMR